MQSRNRTVVPEYQNALLGFGVQGPGRETNEEEKTSKGSTQKAWDNLGISKEGVRGYCIVLHSTA